MLLITGITGHSGKYFFERLKKEKFNDKIKCIIRNNSDLSYFSNSGLNIEFVKGDLNDIDFIEKSMEGVTEIVSIYRIIHSIDIIEQAIAHGVKRVILIHTCGMYSKYKSASSGYLKIEQKVKELVTGSDIKLTILRPTMIYGNPCDKNVIKFIKMIDKFTIFPIIEKGQFFLQPVHAEDLGNAYYDVLMNSNTIGKDYDLSGFEPIAIIDFLQMIARMLGKKRYFVSVPMSFGVFCAKALRMLTIGKIDYIEKVLRLGEDRSRSHELATIDFGYEPMPLEIGLNREIELYLKIKGKAVAK